MLLCDREEQTLDSRDDESFADYVEARGAQLLRLAYLLTGSRELAQDVVQSVLARALLKWGRISSSENVDAYLRRAIINERTSHWRRVGRREVIGAALPDLRAPDDIAATDQRMALLSVLRELPRNQRAALVMRFFDDMPDADIAEILGCTPATVRSHVARALVRVRRKLDVTASDAVLDHSLNGGSS